MLQHIVRDFWTITSHPVATFFGKVRSCSSSKLVNPCLYGAGFPHRTPSYQLHKTHGFEEFWVDEFKLRTQRPDLYPMDGFQWQSVLLNPTSAGNHSKCTLGILGTHSHRRTTKISCRAFQRGQRVHISHGFGIGCPISSCMCDGQMATLCIVQQESLNTGVSENI